MHAITVPRELRWRKGKPTFQCWNHIWSSVHSWHFLPVWIKMKCCLTEQELRQNREDGWPHWKNHTLATNLETSWWTDWERILGRFMETFTSTEIHTYCQLAACTWQMTPRVKVKIDGSERTVKLDSVSDGRRVCHSSETKRQPRRLLLQWSIVFCSSHQDWLLQSHVYGHHTHSDLYTSPKSFALGLGSQASTLSLSVVGVLFPTECVHLDR